jgi:hypothetical protein
MLEVNYLAVLVAGIASMVLGGLWYGPIFGKCWLKQMGWTQKHIEECKKKGMGKSYILNFVAALVTACVLAHVFEVVEVDSHLDGLHVAAGVWLGFVAPVMLGSVLWEQKSWCLYFLNAGFYLVNLAAMSGVIIYMG